MANGDKVHNEIPAYHPFYRHILDFTYIIQMDVNDDCTLGCPVLHKLQHL